MNEQLLQQLTDTLDRLLTRLDAQQEALNAKVDQIIAAVEERTPQPDAPDTEQRIADLEKANADLKAQAARLGRKTISPLVSALLNKYTDTDSLDSPALDKILQALPVEQRIAVKAEMARAGMLE